MTYQEALKIAYPIHAALYGKPRDHQEWAEGFNKRDVIARELMKIYNCAE
jgi:hypothetical protein